MLKIVRKNFNNLSLYELALSTIDRTWMSVFKESEDEINHIEKILKSLYLEHFDPTQWYFYPERIDLFRPFRETLATEVKVVILGLDPYNGMYNDNKKPIACGLAYSAEDTVTSVLGVIFDELKREYDDFETPKKGNLLKWAKQGVLLMNTSFTLFPYTDERSSHVDIWRPIVFKVLETISAVHSNLVFCFFGKEAVKYGKYISGTHLIIETSYPSTTAHNKTDTPFSGSKIFRKINRHLKTNGKKPIDWNL